ncbi:MAG: glutamate ligase domain-containing protein [Pseudohongiellaceae bacterium]
MIDDSYNASPGSFFAAIDVLVSCRGKKVLVMGDMRELGAESATSHQAVGDYAREAGVELLLAVGEESRQTIAAFGPQGLWFADQQQLIDACRELANDQVTFLVKGSRGARMDIVASALGNGGHH